MTNDRSPRPDAGPDTNRDSTPSQASFQLGPPEGARVARGGELHIGDPQNFTPDEAPTEVVTSAPDVAPASVESSDATLPEGERDLEELFSTEPPLGLGASVESEAEDRTVWVDEEDWDYSTDSQIETSGNEAPATLNAESSADGGPPGPPIISDAASSSSLPDPESRIASRDREMGLFEHLAELRTRLLYCFLALAVGSSIAWNKSIEFQGWFAAPILKALRESGKPNGMISTQPTGFFTLTLSFSLVAGLILVMPFILFQVWRFIEPALTNSERRYGLVLVPFSSVLFFLGAGLGYSVSPLFFRFFLQFQPDNIAAQWDYFDSVMLMAKMLLAFGIMFQVPVVIIFLSKIGLLTRDLLIEYWRHAIIAIFLVAAILTPTWDPVSLAVCATPPCLLYLLSIWLVKWL